MKRHKEIHDIPDYLNNFEKRKRKMNFIKGLLQILFVSLFIYLVYDKTDRIINNKQKVDTVYVEKIIHDTIYVRKRK